MVLSCFVAVEWIEHGTFKKFFINLRLPVVISTRLGINGYEYNLTYGWEFVYVWLCVSVITRLSQLMQVQLCMHICVVLVWAAASLIWADVLHSQIPEFSSFVMVSSEGLIYAHGIMSTCTYFCTTINKDFYVIIYFFEHTRSRKIRRTWNTPHVPELKTQESYQFSAWDRFAISLSTNTIIL